MAITSTKLSPEAQYEADLTEEMGMCSQSFERFIYVAFPWGSGELEDFEGPDEWQLELAKQLDEGLLDLSSAVQVAVASGHGIGKSAFVAWLILWSISTFEDTKGVVTANTETQLRTKTWAELGKWYRLFIAKHWFKLTATAIFSAQPGRDRTWRIDMVPWSESNTEAFAGLHNQGKRVVLIMDEGSAIPDIIWETSEGALTDKDTEIIWAVFGNPTRNSGRFKECFGRFRHRWINKQVDSRTVKVTNKSQLNQWVEDWGEDSDFVRVRVRGVFPRAGDAQFIGSDLVEEATKRFVDAVVDHTQPIILGVDVARFGDDQTVLVLRQGRLLRKIWKYRGEDTHHIALRVAAVMDEWETDAVFIDGGGPGAGVVDTLRSMNRTVIEVAFGAKPRDQKHYLNKRVEMWDDMRTWLKTGAIPDDRELHDDLIGPEYGFAREGILQLEKKEDMKKRGLPSPDVGDSLACTFAEHVLQKKFKELRKKSRRPRSQQGYNPLRF